MAGRPLRMAGEMAFSVRSALTKRMQSYAVANVNLDTVALALKPDLTRDLAIMTSKHKIQSQELKRTKTPGQCPSTCLS